MNIFDKKVARKQQRFLQSNADDLIKLYPQLSGYFDISTDPSRRALLLQQLLSQGLPLNKKLLQAQKKRKARARKTGSLRGDLSRNLTAQKRFTRGERRDKDTEEPRIVGEPRQQPIVINVGAGGAAAVPGAAAAGPPPPPGAPPPGGFPPGFPGGGFPGGLPPGPPGGFGFGGGGGGGPGAPGGGLGAPPAIDVAGLRAGIVADIAARLPAPADLDPIREEMRAGYEQLRRGIGGGEVRRQAAQEDLIGRLRGLGGDLAEVERRRRAGTAALQAGLDESSRRRAQDQAEVRGLFEDQQEGFAQGLYDLAAAQGDILGGQAEQAERLDIVRQQQEEQGDVLRLAAQGAVEQQRALGLRLDAMDLEGRNRELRRRADQETVMDRLGFNDSNFDQLQAEAHQAFLQIHRFRQVEEEIAAQGGIMTRSDRDELFRRQQQLLDYLHLGLQEVGQQQTQQRRNELQSVRAALLGNEGPIDPRVSQRGPASPGASPRGLPHGLLPPGQEPPEEGTGDDPRTPGGAPPKQLLTFTSPGGEVSFTGYDTPQSTGVEPPVGGPQPEPEPEPQPEPQAVGGVIPGSQTESGGPLQSSYVGFGPGGGVIDLGEVNVPGAQIGSGSGSGSGSEIDLAELAAEFGGADFIGSLQGPDLPDGVDNPALDLEDRDPHQPDVREGDDTTTDEEEELDFENLPAVSDEERARLEEQALAEALEAGEEGGGFGQEPDPPAQEPGGKKKTSGKKLSDTERRRKQDAELMDRMLEDNDQQLDDDDRRLIGEAIDLKKLDESEKRRRDSARLFDDSMPELGMMIRPGPRGGRGTGYRIRNNTSESILGITGNGLVDIEGVHSGRKGRGVYRLTPGQRHDVDSFYPHIRAGTLLMERGSYRDVDPQSYQPTGDNQAEIHGGGGQPGGGQPGGDPFNFDPRDDPGGRRRNVPPVARYAAEELQEDFEEGGGRPVRVEALTAEEARRQLDDQILRKSTTAKGLRAQIRSLKGRAEGFAGRRGDTGSAATTTIAELNAQANILEREVKELRQQRGPL